MTISTFIPYLGAGLVLYLVCSHSPDAIPKALVPWPLSVIIFWLIGSAQYGYNGGESQ